MKIYNDTDADCSLLYKKTIGIVGYGNQGRAQALNLKDSGLIVIVGLREGSPWRDEAQQQGLHIETIEKTAELSDYLVLLIPDEVQSEVYSASIAPSMTKGKILGFAHGFNIQFGFITPPPDVDVVLNSPKCIGYLVRENFTKGFGFPNVFAVHQDASGRAKDYALAYAKGIGGTRTGVMESTIEEETITNLFGEQVILCGGIVELIKAAFDTLVQAGYQPEIAFFECMHEIKPIIDLFYREGLNEMNRRISNTAEYGEYITGPHIINKHVRGAMKQALSDIQNGTFARQWMNEHKSGGQNFASLRKAAAEHLIEKVGAQMRALMPWSKEKNTK
jgi:ketol-acid reductoisomerase